MVSVLLFLGCSILIVVAATLFILLVSLRAIFYFKSGVDPINAIKIIRRRNVAEEIEEIEQNRKDIHSLS